MNKTNTLRGKEILQKNKSEVTPMPHRGAQSKNTALILPLVQQDGNHNHNRTP